MHFKYAITIFTILFLQSAANAQTAELPIISSVAQSAKDFIPGGWKLDKKVGEVNADLNNDGLADQCYIARKDGTSILFIILARKDGYFVKSFAGVIYAAEYLNKISKRNNTVALTFDFPTYNSTHLVTTYARYQNNDWYVIGYAEEAYTGSGKTSKGTVKDVNLVTGDVEESAVAGTSKTLKKRSKEKKQPLLLLQNVDNLAVLNW